MRKSFYDSKLTFEDNVNKGPFGSFATDFQIQREGEPQYELYGHTLYQPFGIPAGPVMNAKFVQAAFRHGFDAVVYKTVRSQVVPCNPWPNVVPLDISGDLTLDKAEAGLVSKATYTDPLSITNSFGVPSVHPDQWQPDMAEAVNSAGKGQVVIASFEGTRSGTQAEFIKDYGIAAKMVDETGAHVLETNLSCPNEGAGQLVCFDVATTTKIVEAIKSQVPDKPLILKISYFADDSLLEKLMRNVGGRVEGIQTINTIPAKVSKPDGSQALPGRDTSGVCGAAIKWAGLEMVQRLVKLRDELNHSYAILGVGGVTKPEDYQQYRKAGADVVMSATGAMWNPRLAQEVWQYAHQAVTA